MLTCGFFNSVNGDRTYTAEQMNNPYHRLVSNGVFARPDGSSSDDFKVTSDGSMVVSVAEGEGIFDGKWAKSDSPIQVVIPVADVSNPRIDTIVFRVDYETRSGSVELLVGEPAENPTAPEITRSNETVEYRLADIRVNANATGIITSNITDTRAGTDCGFITHLLYQSDITAIYDQWQAEFEDWFREVKETLATSTLIRSYTSQYITLTQGETEIPINISQFKRSLDILQVFVNGLRLIPDEEYTIDSNSQITLAKDVDVNTPVSFVVYKSVDGSDAETVVQQVYELQTKLNVTKVTADTGVAKISVPAGADVLQAFRNAGAGFHTLYSPAGAVNAPAAGAFRYFGHITSPTSDYGFIFAMQADGSVYSNYLNSGTWKGWKVLYEQNPTVLWLGAHFMNADQTIYPSKPLDQCQHGWLLVWSDYDEDTKQKNNYNAVTFCVPKRNASGANWNGSSFMCCLPREVKTDGTFVITAKQVYIYNDRITGFVANSANPANRDVILSAIYEY